MDKFFIRWAINAIAIWVAFSIVPGVTPISSGSPAMMILIVAFIFGLLNATIRPLLKFLSCPLVLVTLGLFVLLINTLMFWLTGYIGEQLGYGFTVAGFWPAFWGALVVSIISVMLNIFVRDGKRNHKRD